MPPISTVSISNRRTMPLDIHGNPIPPSDFALDAVGSSAAVPVPGVIEEIPWKEFSRLLRIMTNRTSGVGVYNVRILTDSVVTPASTIYESLGVSGLLNATVDIIAINQNQAGKIYLQIEPTGGAGNFDWRLTGTALA